MHGWLSGDTQHRTQGGQERSSCRCRCLAIWVCVIWAVSRLAASGVSPEIIDLPTPVDTAYDLTWTMTPTATLTSALTLSIDAPERGRGGYQVSLTSRQASWSSLAQPADVPPIRTPITLSPKVATTWTLKRRPATLALLCNHRLVFTSPAPSRTSGALRITHVPTELRLGEVRYQPFESPCFGDDFMRPEALERMLANLDTWQEDATWQVARYHGVPWPGQATKRDAALRTNPWQLSLFPNPATTTNGFWLLYTGVGPSWVVANPLLASPHWDQFYVETAVKPEYESAVGVLAAYQDDRNYLLFRWYPETRTTDVRAELVAMVDGQSRTLVVSPRGFTPNQWYRVRVNVGWRQAEVLVDDAVLLSAANPGPVEGRIGLYADAVAHPRRPPVDAGTATMYVTRDPQTGVEVNAAEDAQRPVSCIYFDDVRVGPWLRIDDPFREGYPCQQTGRWTHCEGQYVAETPGRLLTGLTTWRRYTLTARLQVTTQGQAGFILQMSDAGRGYVWALGNGTQRLHPLHGSQWQPAVATAPMTAAPGGWVTLRAEVDGPYVACYLDEARVLDVYDDTRTAGRSGVFAGTPGVTFRDLHLTPHLEAGSAGMRVHAGFAQDRWLSTWASADADWMPAHPATDPPATPEATLAGAAAPSPTDRPGRYWHKGGHYHDLTLTLPYTTDTVGGQELVLTPDDDPAHGYQVTLTREGYGTGVITLLRQAQVVAHATLPLPASHARLVVARRGSYLLVRVQRLDPEASADFPLVIEDRLLVCYRDDAPLSAWRLGMTVTNAQLPARAVRVDSDWQTDAFEQAPVGWITQSGVWAVMARYACAPQWNWFGGFGVGAPTAWSKQRLDGDQVVEAYLGVKMQYENMPEEYALRFRDLCLTICSDGAHVNLGYAVIRAGRGDKGPVTMLLRNGVIVASSTDPAHLLPPQLRGHRQWFATRIEKQGADVRVYLDNRLALSYHDPAPLPGGHVALWTVDNGIMVGRVNLAAERVSLGAPMPARPLAVELTAPTVADGQDAANVGEIGIATWQERPGFSGRLLHARERTVGPTDTRTLHVVNTYPAGDGGVTVRATSVDVAAHPLLQGDYCLDPGAQVNLYLRHGTMWREILLTGTRATDAAIIPAGAERVIADGRWHSLAMDLLAHLPAAETRVDEIVLANWSTPALLRRYGFGTNPGGTVMRYADWRLVPRPE